MSVVEELLLVQWWKVWTRWAHCVIGHLGRDGVVVTLKSTSRDPEVLNEMKIVVHG